MAPKAAPLAILGLKSCRSPVIDIRVDASQAEAALEFIGHPSETAWRRIRETPAYRAMRARECSAGVGISESDFRAYLLSPGPARNAPVLRELLRWWRAADFVGSARRALAYLPHGARLRAVIYPVVKPHPNGFVYDLEDGPALFLNLDPALLPSRIETLVAHELYQIGAFAAYRAGAGRLHHAALDWLTAFGEGTALLAAAGRAGPHPRDFGSAADRSRWDRALRNSPRDLASIERFLLAILYECVGEPEVTRLGSSFYGPEGAWYTLGWRMSACVEQRFGRAALAECVLDPRLLLKLYNASAPPESARWSPELIALLNAIPSSAGA